jgi:hypothetical protein
MPLPLRKPGEKKDEFLSRCMFDQTMRKEYSDTDQRYAVCITRSKGSISQQVSDIINNEDDISLGYTEIVDDETLFIPKEEDYIDFGEPVEEFSISQYKYKDPRTGEIYYFSVRRNYIKEGRSLVYIGKASEYQGRKVKLNKPFRTPNGPKKFSVYVKNEKGNVVKVNFGDPNMKIKKNIPERRKSFRARHNCNNPGPKWKARYWSCKAW